MEIIAGLICLRIGETILVHGSESTYLVSSMQSTVCFWITIPLYIPLLECTPLIL